MSETEIFQAVQEFEESGACAKILEKIMESIESESSDT